MLTMNKSKSIQNQASSARRTATSIKKIVDAFDWEYVLDKTKGINSTDRAVLLKASAILSKIGASKSKVARAEKSAEVAKEQAIKLATTQAKIIIAEWKPPVTVTEKVALVIAADFGYTLETYLYEGIPIWDREVEPKDWLTMLNELVADSIKNIPPNAAYHAVNKGESITEVMSSAKNKLDVIKTKPKTALIAKGWSSKISP